MDVDELKQDIFKVQNYLEETYDIATRASLMVLLTILKSWKTTANKELHGRKT